VETQGLHSLWHRPSFEWIQCGRYLQKWGKLEDKWRILLAIDRKEKEGSPENIVQWKIRGRYEGRDRSDFDTNEIHLQCLGTESHSQYPNAIQDLESEQQRQME
jgi:hypothetical protein